jgi:hypothetical protein
MTGAPGRIVRLLFVLPIRLYRYTLSALLGRHCRHLPTCSEYTEDAVLRHGIWAGGWMGAARICRCGPFGTSGFDPVPETCPAHAHWTKPWRYGRWKSVEAPKT